MNRAAKNAASPLNDASPAPTRRGAQRRQAVLDAALDLFLSQGFAATSLDQVIDRAGGSRRTIYQTFGGKEGLLRAVVSESCSGMLDNVDNVGQLLAQTPAQALTHIGELFLDMLITPQRLALFRLVVAESTHSPELGRAFMESGPERAYALVLDYFRAAGAAGQLRLDDPETSARQFLEFVKGDLPFRAMFYHDVADAKTQRRYVDAAVALFLRGAGAPGKGA